MYRSRCPKCGHKSIEFDEKRNTEVCTCRASDLPFKLCKCYYSNSVLMDESIMDQVNNILEPGNQYRLLIIRHFVLQFLSLKERVEKLEKELAELRR